MPTAPRDRSGFQVALFCALPLEAENVQSVFDICWEDQNIHYGKAVGDQNSYTTGLVENHNVVLVHMPSMGGNSAALAAAGVRSSFTRIQLALVVGVCGVAPVHPVTKQEIILGDVVISTAVVQYDFGRQYPGGFRRKSELEDSLSRANPEIRSFINMLATRQNRQRFQKQLGELIHSDEYRTKGLTGSYPGSNNDTLYEPSYIHQHRSDVACDKCLLDLGTCARSCDELECEDDRSIPRKRHSLTMEQRGQGEAHVPCVHLGRFGSANTVMRSGLVRDRISAADEILAFEMEGAGVWEQYPTIVIKSACDYSDNHKNKSWQGYAAAMAAVSLKVFLKQWTIPEQLSSTSQHYDLQDPSRRDSILPAALSQPVWCVPFDAIPGFVGRTDELEKLQTRLFDSDSSRVVSLLGLGGVGKSRLALELAHQTKSKYPQHSIFWVQASNQLTMENDMLEIGRKLGIADINNEKADVKALVKKRLSVSATDRWLLILDNADDEVLWGRRSNSSQQEVSLVNFLPRTVNGSILITTRTRRVASFLAGKEVITLGTMTQDKAAELFISKLEDPDLAIDQVLLSDVLHKLSYLPLAIVQAASFVNMTGVTIQTYLDLLNRPEAEVVELLSEDFGDASRYSDAINPIAATWLISFKHIQEQHSLAADFLSTMVCLHEKNIPSSLLPEVESKVDSIRALAVLTGYSFVTKQSGFNDAADKEELYDVHRLVRLAAVSWLKKTYTFAKWIEACLVRLAHLFPTRRSKHKNLWTMYLPHAQHVCEQLDGNDLIEKYYLLEKMGLVFGVTGEYKEAVRVVTAVVEWRERTLGKADQETLGAYSLLGEALNMQGNHSQAEYYLRKAVDGLVAVRGQSDHNTLISMNNLANSLNGQGQHAEAEKIYREVLQMREATLGDSHPDTLTNMSNLAMALSQQGNNVEAEKIHRKALRLQRLVVGDSDLSTLVTMNSLAIVLRRQGNHVEAEKMHREVLHLKETALGKTHPSTLASMHGLAIVLRDQGSLVEAEGMLREVLRSKETLLGISHPSTLRSMSALAIVVGKQDRNFEAEKIQREVLQSKQTVLGKAHPDTLSSMHDLARTVKQQNRTEEAVDLMRHCIELRTKTLGPAHPDTQKSLDALSEWTGTSCSTEQQGEGDRTKTLETLNRSNRDSHQL